MAFQFETSHETHRVDVAQTAPNEFLAYVASNYNGGGSTVDMLELGTFNNRHDASTAVTVAMLAMQRVTR
jgi:hypothetical protein